MARKKAAALMWALTLLIASGNPAKDRACRVLKEPAGTAGVRCVRHGEQHVEDRIRLRAQTQDARRLLNKTSSPQTQVEGDKQ